MPIVDDPPVLQVIDASVVVAALVDDSAHGRWAEDRLLDAELAAPHLLPFEVANVLRRFAARGVMSLSDAAAALDDLGALPIGFVPFDAIAARVWALRDTHTAYDASYVAAAELLDAPLVTLDGRLARAPGIGCRIISSPATP